LLRLPTPGGEVRFKDEEAAAEGPTGREVEATDDPTGRDEDAGGPEEVTPEDKGTLKNSLIICKKVDEEMKPVVAAGGQATGEEGEGGDSTTRKPNVLSREQVTSISNGAAGVP
jgi:hypothetical protein